MDSTKIVCIHEWVDITAQGEGGFVRYRCAHCGEEYTSERYRPPYNHQAISSHAQILRDLRRLYNAEGMLAWLGTFNNELAGRPIDLIMTGRLEVVAKEVNRLVTRPRD